MSEQNTSITTVKEAPPPPKGGNPLIAYRGVKKAFGKQVVYDGLDLEVRKGETLHWWVAYSPQMKGVPRRTRKYAIAKHGEEEAFAMAVRAREEFVTELREVEFLHHPVARQLKRALQIE